MSILGGLSVTGLLGVLRQGLPFGGVLDGVRAKLWALALLFFCVGDVTTTHAGLSISGVVEAGPVVAPLVREYGVAAMIGLKAATVGLFYGFATVLPEPQSAGVPLGLTLVGLSVTGWNLVVISLAVL